MPRYLQPRTEGPGKVNTDPSEPTHKFRYPFLSPTHDLPKKKQLGESIVIQQPLAPKGQ